MNTPRPAAWPVLSLLLLFLAGLTGPVGPAARAAVDPDLLRWAALPGVMEIELSPDGNRLGWLQSNETAEGFEVRITDLEGRLEQRQPFGDTLRIRDIEWIDDQRLRVDYVRVPQPVFNGSLVVTRGSPDPLFLWPRKGEGYESQRRSRRSVNVGLAPDNPDAWVIFRPKTTGERSTLSFELVWLALESGKLLRQEDLPGRFPLEVFALPESGFVAEVHDEDGRRAVYRSRDMDAADWNPVELPEPFDRAYFDLHYVSPDRQMALVSYAAGPAETEQLALWHFEKGTLQTVIRDPNYGIFGQAMADPVTHSLYGFVNWQDKPQTIFFSENLRSVWQSLNEQMGSGALYPVDLASGLRVMITSQAGGEAYPRWSLFLPSEGELRPVYELHGEELDDPVQPNLARIPIGDGPPVEGTMFLPANDPQGGPYPTIIQLPGDNERHTMLWSPEVQMLTEAGYAVLLLNPRSVSGFGPAYRGPLADRYSRAAADVQAAIAWAAKYRLTDPERVALSTGGNSAGQGLYAAVKHPDTLAALVFTMPRFGYLRTLRDSYRGRQPFTDREQVGRMPYEDALDFLREREEVSWRDYAAELTGPVLVGAYRSMETGRRGRGLAEEIIGALERNDQVTYREFDGEYVRALDRYYPESVHRDWWAVQLAFLAEHLRPEASGGAE